LNEKKTKKLRKEIYGDQSLKTRTYQTIAVGFWESAKKFVTRGSAIVCTGLRRQYQDAKKAA
jgi:hypothetical protein